MKKIQALAQRVAPQGSLVRGVVVLSTGTAASQVIGLLVLPLLTRLYTPGEYGVLAVFAGILALVTVVASLRYALAIPLPLRDGAAFQVVALAGIVVCVVAILAAGMQIIASSLMPEELQSMPTALVAGLMLLGVLTAGWYQVGSSWAIRRKEYGVIARTRVQRGLAGAGMQVLLGVFNSGAIGLIMGLIAGQMTGLYRLTASLYRTYKIQGVRVHWRGLRWAAARYKRFPIYDSWAGLLNTASSQAPAVLFAILFTPQLAGFYVLALRIISAPIGLIGSSIAQSILPRIVEARRGNELAELIRNTQCCLARVSFIPFAVFMAIAPELFGYIFGSEWDGAGSVAAWTALWVSWQFVYSPLSVLHMGLEAQTTNLVLQAIFFVMRVGAIGLGYLLGSSDMAIIFFSLMSLFSYMSGAVVLSRMASVPLKVVVKDYFKESVFAFIAFFIVSNMLSSYGLIWALVSVLPIAGGYLVGVFSLRHKLV
jgi:O-antigen/teichoic acid export membrane protein